MKRILIGTLLFFSILFSVSAQEGGRYVAVTAEKDAAIQNGDVPAARTTALMLAARDAVEKAYGTYVDVKQLPEGREIMAKESSSLRYTILAEQQKGNRYWVKIQASVLVPEQYSRSETTERESLGDQMKNFVQKYPQGEINWGDGFIIAHGKGEITSPKDPNAEAKAARAAELDAKAHLLEIINDIPVDDQVRAGGEKKMSFALQGFVQGAQIAAQTKSGTTVTVTVQAPIRGVKGLSMTILGYYTPEPPAVAEAVQPTALPDADNFTGVVIDARKVPVNPAVFPKIKDTKNHDVHSVQSVNREDLEKRGMASYAVVARDVEISRLFPHAAVITIAYMPEGDQSAPSKQKRRQGYKPLVVTAVDAGGQLKANLIVSEEDAKKMKTVDEKTGAMKQCRVVVVVSSEVGGLEGLLMRGR
jgi:hypothetical protein